MLLFLNQNFIVSTKWRSIVKNKNLAPMKVKILAGLLLIIILFVIVSVGTQWYANQLMTTVQSENKIFNDLDKQVKIFQNHYTSLGIQIKDVFIVSSEKELASNESAYAKAQQTLKKSVKEVFDVMSQRAECALKPVIKRLTPMPKVIDEGYQNINHIKKSELQLNKKLDDQTAELDSHFRQLKGRAIIVGKLVDALTKKIESKDRNKIMAQSGKIFESALQTKIFFMSMLASNDLTGAEDSYKSVLSYSKRIKRATAKIKKYTGTYPQLKSLLKHFTKLDDTADKMSTTIQTSFDTYQKRLSINEQLKAESTTFKAALDDTNKMIGHISKAVQNRLKENTISSNEKISHASFISNLMLVIISFIGILFGFLTAGKVSKPVLSVTALATEIADGVLDGDDLHDSSSIETYKLSKSINHMKGELRHLIIKLNDVSSHLNSDSKQTLSEMDLMLNRTENINDEINSATVVTEEISVTSEEIANRISEAIDEVKTMKEMVVTNNQNLQEEVVVVSRLAGQLEQMDSKLDALHGASKKVGDIIKMIVDIADRTNLLALNASIEAAHAGEVGKGFAVVAGEVRNLSENTMDAVSSITEIIKNIDDSVNDIVNTTKQSVDEIKDVANDMNNMGKQFNMIDNYVSNVTDQIAPIADSALEQSSAISEINKLIMQINSDSEENTQFLEGFKGSTENLVEQVNEISVYTQKYKC